MKVIAPTLILVAMLLITSACGSNDQITVHDAWARPGFLGDNSAIYLTIQNHSESGDGLIGVDTDIAGSSEIHLSKMDSAGNMTMEQQNLVVFPPNGTVEFSPGGLHIMLVNLMKDLSVEDTFQLTLQFQRAGDMTVEVEVKQPVTE